MAQEQRPEDIATEETASDAAAAISSADLAAHEIADLKTKLARWQADFQNLQRRAAQEVLAARQNADADFAKNMLQVLDHFDMALNVDPAKVDARTLLDGVKITYDELKKVLANRGIESYDPTGKPFDPHLHEAIMQEESSNHAPMMVIQTFQQGFKIGDRVLRPAKVKVSK
ncbi:MAG TPA: nucleotide exchange factor GrpE [Phycisphaerae bacterium]|jgi:molecular chaperone GrpE|nr:nucleotide exchange factor GrpE [Phycisphaerae bacterium]